LISNLFIFLSIKYIGMRYQNRKFTQHKKAGSGTAEVAVVRPKLSDGKPAPAAAQCFSGTCGLCAVCCSNSTSTDISKEKDRRYSDMSKLMGKSLIEEYRGVYIARLNHWTKSRGYTDPQYYGVTPLKIKYKEETFHLYKKRHGEACDDPYCRALYNSENEYTQKKRYVKYPIYKSDKRDIRLCGVCMDRCIDK
jgi:hypothetical protein